MDVCREALEVHTGKNLANLDKEIQIDNEESELDRERVDKKQYPTEDFVTRLELQKWSQPKWKSLHPTEMDLWWRTGGGIVN